MFNFLTKKDYGKERKHSKKSGNGHPEELVDSY